MIDAFSRTTQDRSAERRVCLFSSDRSHGCIRGSGCPLLVLALFGLRFARHHLRSEKKLFYGGRSLRKGILSTIRVRQRAVATIPRVFVLTVLPIAVRNAEDQPGRRREGAKMSRTRSTVICARVAGLRESRQAGTAGTAGEKVARPIKRTDDHGHEAVCGG